MLIKYSVTGALTPSEETDQQQLSQTKYTVPNSASDMKHGRRRFHRHQSVHIRLGKLVQHVLCGAVQGR